MDVNWIIESPFDQLPVGDRRKMAVSIDGMQSLTYEQLYERRNRFAHVLSEAGVGQGDRVGFVMLNCLDYIALYFAIARIGAIAVRINFRLTQSELSYIIRDAGCSMIVFHASRADQLEPIRHDVGVGRWLCLPDGVSPPDWATVPDVESASAEDPRLPRPSASDPLMIMYTSGTTGRPKGSVWTHQNSVSAACMQAIGWSYTQDTVALSAGPMHHVMGLEAMMLPALLVHGSMVLLSSTGLTLDRIIQAIHNAGVTIIWLPPFLIYELLRKEDLDPGRLSSLRLIMSGGDPLQPWAVTAMKQKLPDVAIQQGYGLTEGGSMVTILDPAHQALHPGSVGRPFPLTQVRTMKDETRQAGPDEVGEIWVRSPAISGIYWNRPEESRVTFADGWCRTGDLGRVTPDGFLVIAGRSKDMIRSGGENVYPAEIEAVLAQHPDVSSLAVIAVPDQKYIEAGCAVVKLRDPSCDRAALEQSLRELAGSKLAKYKCPKHYVFVNDLPLNQTGKIQKLVLRERYASLGATPVENQ